jgi:hypothetical protein
MERRRNRNKAALAGRPGFDEFFTPPSRFLTVP